ncbi:MAG: hypothetical protein ACRD1K_08375 [Acidimicrobiales bacterium]
MTESNSCSCGCSSMTAVTEAKEPCGCGCECCGESAKAPAEEIAELTRLRASIERRLVELGA